MSLTAWKQLCCSPPKTILPVAVTVSTTDAVVEHVWCSCSCSLFGINVFVLKHRDTTNVSL